MVWSVVLTSFCLLALPKQEIRTTLVGTGHRQRITHALDFFMKLQATASFTCTMVSRKASIQYLCANWQYSRLPVQKILSTTPAAGDLWKKAQGLSDLTQTLAVWAYPQLWVRVLQPVLKAYTSAGRSLTLLHGSQLISLLPAGHTLTEHPSSLLLRL